MITLEYQGLSGAIAGNIRAEAVRAGYTQTSLAKALGRAQSMVSPKWRGVRLWQLDELEPVAEVLGVPVTKLLEYDPLRARRDLNPQPPDP